MRNFQQFLESTPNTMNPHLNHLREIENIIEQQKQKISRLVEQNNVYLKALAKIKIDLERRLKRQEFYNSEIDLDFLTINYLKILDSAFSGNDHKVAIECLEALERLHFPQNPNKQ